MIELLKGFSDNVAAFALHEHVTKADYDGVLIPDFEDRLRRHKKLRIYIEIAADSEGFDPGAVWEDQKLGWKHFFDWERCALVTDVAWAKHAAKFSEFLAFCGPGNTGCFQKLKLSRHTIGLSKTRNRRPETASLTRKG